MKRIFISFLAALSLSVGIFAQESLDVKIDAALAQMPAENMEVFNTVMDSFLPQTSDFIVTLSSRLVPAAEGPNAKVEYLLNGFISYLSASEFRQYRDEAVKGLEKAIAECADQPNKVFLQERLYLLSKYTQPEAYKELTISKAKSQLKKKDSHLKTEAMAAIFAAQGTEALAYALKAMKDNDRKYRMSVLKIAEPYADESFYASLAEILKNKKSGSCVKADILRWFGSQYAESQIDLIAANAADEDEEIAQAAIASLGKIGGQKALETLMGCLGGANDAAAYSALLSFNGDIAPAVLNSLETPSALKLAQKRKIYAAYDKVYSLLSSDDKDLSAAAYNALSGVATAADFYPLCDLMEKASADNAAKVQKAIVNVVSALPSDVCLKRLANTEKKSLYYPVLAKFGDAESIVELMKGYEGSDRQLAMASLLTVDNAKMPEILYGIAVSDKENAEKALNRYVALVNKHMSDPKAVFEACTKALELKPSDAVASKLLKTLSGTQIVDAIYVAVPYLENKATASSAASAIKQIASKNVEGLKGEKAVNALKAALEHYRKGKSADDGYAVDEINLLLDKIK